MAVCARPPSADVSASQQTIIREALALGSRTCVSLVLGEVVAPILAMGLGLREVVRL